MLSTEIYKSILFAEDDCRKTKQIANALSGWLDHLWRVECLFVEQTNINEGAVKVDRKSSCIIFHLFPEINYLSVDYYRWMSS